MSSSEKQWFVMRDLKRRNSNTLAIHTLRDAGLEVFTPMTQMIMTIGGRRQRREVPVIQDLLFVHETREALDPIVARTPSLQYRYLQGHPAGTPMTVRTEDMTRFIYAITATSSSDNLSNPSSPLLGPRYYLPTELTPAMYGRKVRIIGGSLDGYEGHLLSVRGLRTPRLLVSLPGLLTAAVEVTPAFIHLLSNTKCVVQ